jgi:hypothetical protein
VLINRRDVYSIGLKNCTKYSDIVSLLTVVNNSDTVEVNRPCGKGTTVGLPSIRFF